MNETRQWLQAFSRFQTSGLRSALAVVVRVEGSSYRRPGAKMLIAESGEVAGAVSGGCLERDLIRRAVRLLRSDHPLRERVIYDTRIDREGDEDLSAEMCGTTLQPSLGCEGVIEILIEPEPAPWASLTARAWEAGKSRTLVCPLEPAGPVSLLAESVPRVGVLKDGVYFDPIHAPVELTLLGAGHDAVVLARMARELGWVTTVVDCHSAFPQPRARFAHVDHWISSSVEESVTRAKVHPGSIAIVMTHHRESDARILQDLLRANPRYIGLLGPRKRGEGLLTEALAATGLAYADFADQVRFPVGADLGGEGPAAIALSILAEIQAVLHERGAGFLRDRRAPIHDRTLAVQS